jgi:hypothetical protein
MAAEKIRMPPNICYKNAPIKAVSFIIYNYIYKFHIKTMKAIKTFSLLAFFLTASFSAFSQTKTGQVYLIRSTGYTGSAVNYSFYVDDELTCKMKNKLFSIHDLPVGDHTVSVVSGGISNGKKSPPLKITVVEGKVNYVSVVSTQSGYVNKITCQEITQSSADPILAKTKQKNDCLPKK